MNHSVISFLGLSDSFVLRLVLKFVLALAVALLCAAVFGVKKDCGADGQGEGADDSDNDDEDEDEPARPPIHPIPEEALFLFAMTGYEEELQAVLDGGVHVDTRDEDGHTPLMYTAHGDTMMSAFASVNELSGKIDALFRLRGEDNPDTRIERESTHVRMCRYLLDHGANVNARDNKGLTPLMYAATNAPLETDVQHPGLLTIALLLEAGADIDAADCEGRTALLHAALNRNGESVEALLQAGANCKLRTKDGRDFADCLAEGGLPDVLRRVLSAPGADCDAPDSRGRTRLMRLRGWRRASAAQVLLDLGADMEARDRDGVSVYEYILRGGLNDSVPFIARGKDIPNSADAEDFLFMAAWLGNTAAMRRLLDHFKPSPGSNVMLDVIDVSAREGHAGVVELLLAAGVDPDSVLGGWRDHGNDKYKNGVHARGSLMQSLLGCEHQDMPTIRVLLKAGANVHRWDRLNRCNACLLAVAGAGTPEIFQMIVEAGVNPAKSNADALLERASTEGGNPSMVDYILDNLKTTPAGRTAALGRAFAGGNIKLAQHLVERGAKVADSTLCRAAEASSPTGLLWLLDHGYKGDWDKLLLLAASNVRGGQVRCLLSQGADPNAKDKAGRTALMCAICTRGFPAFAREAIVRDLLAAGADPNACDNDGNDPVTSCLRWSGFWGRRIIPMLVRAGARIPATNAKGVPLAKLLAVVDCPAPIRKALSAD